MNLIVVVFEVSRQKQQRNNSKNIQTYQNISHRAIKRTINLYPSPLKSYGDFIFKLCMLLFASQLSSSVYEGGGDPRVGPRGDP